MRKKGKLSIRDIHICFVLYKSLEELRVTQCLNDYSTGFKTVYLTFLKHNIYISKKQRKETCTEHRSFLRK